MQTQIRMDDEQLLLTQEQLKGTLTKIYERDYSKRFKAANGEIGPVRIWSEYASKKYVEVGEYDYFGLAEVIADWSKGGPRVGVTMRRQMYPIRTVGDHAAWSWEEILLARGEGVPLQEKNLSATRIAFEAKFNKTCYFGDPDYGLPGLFTSNLGRLNVSSTFRNASGFDAKLAILSNAYTSLKEQNDLAMPKILVLPEKQVQDIGSTTRATAGSSSESVLTAFLNLQKEMGGIEKVVVDNNLKGAGTNGEDCMLLLPDDEEEIVFVMAMDYTVLPVQQTNLEHIVHALGRIIGAVAHRVDSGLIVEGI